MVAAVGIAPTSRTLQDRANLSQLNSHNLLGTKGGICTHIDNRIRVAPKLFSPPWYNFRVPGGI